MSISHSGNSMLIIASSQSSQSIAGDESSRISLNRTFFSTRRKQVNFLKTLPDALSPNWTCADIACVAILPTLTLST
jgi:hypothetical protein